MKTDLLELIDWFRDNKLSLNLSKTNCVIFRKSTDNTNIANDLSFQIGDATITRASTVTFLGLHIDEHLSWSHHLKNVQNKLSKSVYILNSVKNSTHLLYEITIFIVFSTVTYIMLWGPNLSKNNLNCLFKTQKKMYYNC